MLDLRQVTVMYSGIKCIDDVSLSLKKGSVYVLIGPNGSGKSTLMKMLVGLLPLSGGSVYYDGDSIQKRMKVWRRRLSYMPQYMAITAKMPAIDVVMLGTLENLSIKVNDQLLKKGLDIMDQMGCLSLSNRDISQLSGGERQMVLFSQTLISDPEVLFLDEPVSALDLYYQMRLLDKVREETKKRNMVTLIILHDLNLAAQYADEIILINRGKVPAMGRCEDVLIPDLIESVYRVNVECLKDRNDCVMIQPHKFIEM